jgi:shikimate kinase/3-dehydroquinate synthase
MAFVLIGFMGAGKSTVAAELAEALGSTVLDSDELLAERFGHPVAHEFALHGEESFRAAEDELVCRLLSDVTPETVIALGGGSVLSERVRDALQEHVTVLIDVEPHLAWARVRAEVDGAERPLAQNEGDFLALYESRHALYEQLADAIFKDLPLGGATRTLAGLRALSAMPKGTRLLWASSVSGEYPVLIGRGMLDVDVDVDADVDAGERLELIWPLDRTRSRAFCVSDETVAGLYGERLGPLAGTIAIAPGEDSKTLASAERVWQAMVTADMTRADHVVALGGGVVGDLAGFCAGTYQRGVAVVQVPTTLVAQVDSAYGGKTGVDLPEAKNYVGVYHQPAGVLVDPETLATLPAAETRRGLR